MKRKKTSILVFIYNSYKDPLFQNLLLSYIKTLSSKGDFRFDLVTFEQEQYKMSSGQINSEKAYLEQYNIYWHPRQFHTGRFLLFKKLFDVLVTVMTVIKIKIKYKSNYVFAFANVAAAFSVIFARILRLKLVIYSYEPHSDFMVELGLWNENSLKYKILNTLEVLAGKYADHVLTGTKYGVELLNTLGSKADIYRAPTAVDHNDFSFRPSGRDKIRKKYNVEENDVVLYIGKFGDLYYTEEVTDLFQGIYSKNKNVHFIIVTAYDHDTIRQWMLDRKLPQSSFDITKNLTNEEIKEYISAADLGISAVPPSPSQKYRSPTKVAEYLLCGLPYITCVGVSEDDDYAIENQVGVVLNDFSKSEIDTNYDSIEKLLKEDKQSLRDRCRSIGLEYRSKQNIDSNLKDIFR